jgi:CheY-like chemotaxis protein
VSMSGTSRLILVVEDEWIVREVIAEALRSGNPPPSYHLPTSMIGCKFDRQPSQFRVSLTPAS